MAVVDDDRLLLADPQLAVELLSTLRHQGDELVDDLEDPGQARRWLEAHLGAQLGKATSGGEAVVRLVQLRERMRELFTAIVAGQAPPAAAVAALNQAAAQAPVTLVAHRATGGTLKIERLPATGGSAAARGEFARAALALLTDDLRGRLRLCRAPNCVLFFLQTHPRQRWCSSGCGNRARVARHYARQRRRA